jgi:hypothetical protein
MNLREAAQQALEALKMIDNAMPFPVAKHAIKQLSAALAEPERKPLTDEEIELLAVKHAPPIDPAFAQHDDFIEFARAIERAHGIGGEA